MWARLTLVAAALEVKSGEAAAVVQCGSISGGNSLLQASLHVNSSLLVEEDITELPNPDGTQCRRRRNCPTAQTAGELPNPDGTECRRRRNCPKAQTAGELPNPDGSECRRRRNCDSAQTAGELPNTDGTACRRRRDCRQGVLSETRELHITINGPDDLRRFGAKIFHAMQQASLSPSEWTFVDMPKVDHHRSAQDRFPETYTVTLRPFSGIPINVNGFESAEDQNAYAEALGYDPIVRLELLQSSNTSYQEVSEIDEGVQLLAESTTAAKYRKQKQWAARSVVKLEPTVCQRNKHGLPPLRWREWGTPAWLNGGCGHRYENIGGLCIEYCGNRERPSELPGFCQRTCAEGWASSGYECFQKCNLPQLPLLQEECGYHWCTDNSITCGKKIFDMAYKSAQALSSFMPSKSAMNGLRKAARKAAIEGSKAALKKAIKKAATEVAKKFLKKAKKNLRKYMKGKKTELPQEVEDAILEGGIESVAELAIAKSEPDNLGEAAIELLRAVDPTGISDIIKHFEEQSCQSMKIDPMPGVWNSEDLLDLFIGDSASSVYDVR